MPIRQNCVTNNTSKLNFILILKLCPKISRTHLETQAQQTSFRRDFCGMLLASWKLHRSPCFASVVLTEGVCIVSEAWVPGFCWGRCRGLRSNLLLHLAFSWAFFSKLIWNLMCVCIDMVGLNCHVNSSFLLAFVFSIPSVYLLDLDYLLWFHFIFTIGICSYLRIPLKNLLWCLNCANSNHIITSNNMKSNTIINCIYKFIQL